MLRPNRRPRRGWRFAWKFGSRRRSHGIGPSMVPESFLVPIGAAVSNHSGARHRELHRWRQESFCASRLNPWDSGFLVLLLPTRLNKSSRAFCSGLPLPCSAQVCLPFWWFWWGYPTARQFPVPATFHLPSLAKLNLQFLHVLRSPWPSIATSAGARAIGFAHSSPPLPRFAG